MSKKIYKKNTNGQLALEAELLEKGDAYSKSEVDSKLGGKANSSHTHSVDEISDLEIATVDEVKAALGIS